MPDIDWDCWIGDESGGSKVWFRDTDQPKPIPLPERDWSGSIHALIAPGAFELQSAGYGPPQLTVNLVVEYEDWLLIEGLITRIDDTTKEHKSVQFSNSYQTFLCTSIGKIKPDLTTRRPIKVVCQLVLMIHSVVT